MPSGKAAAIRDAFRFVDKSDLVLARNPCSKTGFTGVIPVAGGMFQARMQVKGDGRGGVRKRRQESLGGLFDSAQEAAEFAEMQAAHAKRLSETIFCRTTS